MAVMIEFRNFRAHAALGPAVAHDPAVPVPQAGDVIEVEQQAYVCRHRSFEYRDGALASIFVMVEPDE